jgi:hypothetical protein
VALGADVGILFPKNSALIIQVHYNLENAGDGEPPSDQTRVALYFHDAPPKLRLLTVPIANTTFQLEPGVIAKEVTAEFSLDLQGQLGIPVPEILVPRFSALLVAPHMHQLGRQIRAEMRPPGADPVSLIQIDDWDFHWQGFYEYQQRVALPYRSKIKLACTFDNPTNRVVGWGESTEDEMCLLYMSFVAEGALGALFGNPQ